VGFIYFGTTCTCPSKTALQNICHFVEFKLQNLMILLIEISFLVGSSIF